MEQPPVTMQSLNQGSTDADLASRPDAESTHGGAWEESVRVQTDAAFISLTRNAKLNYIFRVSLYTLTVLATACAVLYTWRRGDDMVGVLLDAERGTGLDEARLISLAVPVALFVILAAASLAGAILTQGRGASEFEEGLEAISRLRREAHAGVSRRRSMIEVIEAYLVNARRAFRLQLLLNQSLFAVFITLFAIAVVHGVMNGLDLTTAALGAGSLISLIFGVLSTAAIRVGANLADATQIQLVVSSTVRQLNVIEENLYKTIEVGREAPTRSAPFIEHGARQMAHVTSEALDAIQRYAEYEPSRPRRRDPLRHEGHDRNARGMAANGGADASGNGGTSEGAGV